MNAKLLLAPLLALGLTLGPVPPAPAAAVSADMSARPDQYAPPAPWLVSAWDAFKAAFVIDGRVRDDANGISHSEGQGYAMLIAVRANDATAFEEIWIWTRDTLMVREDGLAAWRYEPGKGVTDANNATDGDLLIAWALVEAATRWRRGDYFDSARELMKAVARHTIASSAHGDVIRPAVMGFEATDRPDGPVVNPSYWVFPAFPALRAITPEIDWDSLTASGKTIIDKGRFGILRLPPDWLSMAGDKLEPAEGFPARFSYNAIRIPLYLAWAGSDPRHLRPFAGLWSAEADVGPFEIDLRTGAATETFGGEGFKAIAALVDCALASSPLDKRLRRVPIELYYPTILHILTLLAFEERYPECL